MNIFGLFFSFLMPGFALGIMGGYLISRTQFERRIARAAARRRGEEATA